MPAAGQATANEGVALRAPYACDPKASRGRLHDEPESRGRSPFRRDCDRIIHATAFRRLKHKTQVFVFDEGDHYAPRLIPPPEVPKFPRPRAAVCVWTRTSPRRWHWRTISAIRRSGTPASVRSIPASRALAASITMRKPCG